MPVRTGTKRLLVQIQLGNAVATVFDPGAAGLLGPGQSALITGILIANTDTANRTVTLHYLKSGGAISTVTQIIPGSTMLANEMAWIPVDIPLAYGDMIQGLASTAAVVNVMLFGFSPDGGS
jgi:hypothetical protein